MKILIQKKFNKGLPPPNITEMQLLTSPKPYYICAVWTSKFVWCKPTRCKPTSVNPPLVGLHVKKV